MKHSMHSMHSGPKNSISHALDPQFNLIEEEELSGFNMLASLYESNCGASHLHLTTQGPDNAFYVAFRTPPPDSKGVAHILEHTTLCGSKDYPVRDPFFGMLNRSVSSFMNAMTASDWTAYPFATSVKADFLNLLSVYLDATFYPNLDQLDFAQEGHRLRYNTDGSKKLEYSGVVFNEMKGAQSSPTSQAYTALNRHLKAGSPYAYVSGGDPVRIPELTYADLVQFHRAYYSPSNAIFATSGDIPADELHNIFIQYLKSRFESDHTWGKRGQYTSPTPITSPKTITDHIQSSESAAGTHQVITAWLLPKSDGIMQSLKCELIEELLLDNNASPLRETLQNSPYSSTLSPLCGFDDSEARTSFSIGLENIDEKDVGAIEGFFLKTLEKIAQKGFSSTDIDAALSRMEFDLREIHGTSAPFGLQLLISALPAMVHGTDCIKSLNRAQHLPKLREEATSEAVCEWIVSLILQNKHRVTLQLKGISDYLKLQEEELQEKLHDALKGATEDDLQEIENLNKNLEKRQNTPDDPAVLPRLQISEIPALPTWEQPSEINDYDGVQTHIYEAGTNGILYLRCAYPIVADVPHLDLLPLYVDLLDEMGTCGRTFEQTSKDRAQAIGSLTSSLAVFVDESPDLAKNGNTKLWLSVKGKALNHRGAALFSEFEKLLSPTAGSVDFADQKNLNTLLERGIAQFERSISSQAMALAHSAAKANIHPADNVRNFAFGLPRLHRLKRVYKAIQSGQGVREIAAKLQEIHTTIQSQSPKAMLVADHDSLQKNQSLFQNLSVFAQSELGNLNWDDFETRQSSLVNDKTAWTIDSPVSFTVCTKSVPTLNHPSAPALTVAATWLRQNYLHPHIREKGGAYGAGTSYASQTGCFSWQSYRDPHFSETLKHYEKSCTQLLKEIDSQSQEAFEESILGAVKAFHTPVSPSENAQLNFTRHLRGASEEHFAQFYDRLLHISKADVKKAVATYLENPLAEGNIAAFIAPEKAAELANWQIKKEDWAN